MQPGHAGDGRAAARPAGRGRLDPRASAWTARSCCVIVGPAPASSSATSCSSPARSTGTYVDGGPTELALAGRHLPASPLAAATAPGPGRSDGRPSAPAWAGGCSPSRSICNVASLFVLAAGWGDSLPSAAAWLAIGCVVAAIARTAVTFREVRAFNEVKQQARTDELTGLANRRALLDAAAAGARRRRRPAARRPCCCSTSTASRRSTTASATTPATNCSARSARGCSRRCAPASSSPASAVTSSPSCCPSRRWTRPQPRGRRLRELILAAVPRRGHPAARRASASASPRAPVPAATVAGAPALRRRRHVRRQVRPARACTSTCRSPTAAPATGSAPWRNSGRRCESDQLVVHLQPQVGLRRRPRRRGRGAGALEPPDRAGCSPPPSCCPPPNRPDCSGPLTDRVLELSLDRGRPLVGRASEVPVSVNLSAANVTDLDLPGKVAGRADAGTVYRPQALDPGTGRGHPDGRPGAGPRRCSASCAASASGRRSTTTAPATARWPTCGNLPADELKLDRSLTLDVGTDPPPRPIVKHTVALAHDLGTAPGGRRRRGRTPPAAALRDLGCDIAQGYAIARPMPVDAFLQWLVEPSWALVDDAH